MDQWSILENPERNPHLNGQLVHEKEGKNMQCGKDSPSMNGIGKAKYSQNWTMFRTIHKSNLKCIKDLNQRPETITNISSNF